ncbi:MAG: L-arabinose transport system permease protein AraQ [Candidatus Atribacteria bacterium ADurb.Bin276]|jgi:multiple sugar transport system permease protein|uniref:L-arabinose transport system permease protein AraQ n=1 Tax=Candidatus Atribacter allofermentans TaxID=1852833 RepID=A0A1V5SVC3_9BACT|nr:MAG: L-arabinose transport system permease protein AraQ [Candidatus Atribacteria bacterium ADurb.Bin276]
MSWKKAIIYGILIILCFLWILPIWPTVLVSLKSNLEFGVQKFWELPSQNAFWSNLVKAWNQAKLGRYFINSLLYGLIGAVGAIFIASLAAFSISRLNIKNSFSWFFLIWSGTIFPFQMYLIPLFKMYMSWGLYDTFLGMILFYIAICIPFCTFIFRNYFLTLPGEVLEAAKLDGCSNLKAYWKIFMPLSKPAIAVLLLFQFTWVWNDLMFGMVLTRSTEVRPIMVGLAQLQGFRAGSGTDIPSLMAGAFAASLPTIILFVFLQRYFIEGMKLSTAGE